MAIVTITPEIAQAQYCVPCLYISAGTLRNVVKGYYAINCSGSFSTNLSSHPSKVVAEMCLVAKGEDKLCFCTHIRQSGAPRAELSEAS